MSDKPLIVFPGHFGKAAEKLVETLRHVIDVGWGTGRARAVAQSEADAA
jgi:hypothetical protein